MNPVPTPAVPRAVFEKPVLCHTAHGRLIDASVAAFGRSSRPAGRWRA